MGRGKDITSQTKLKIWSMYHESKRSVYNISKTLKIHYETAKLWALSKKEVILKTGNFEADRKGKVGRKPIYSPTSKKKLIERLETPKMTQVKLAAEQKKIETMVTFRIKTNF